jgi:homoserine dehydrogenase
LLGRGGSDLTAVFLAQALRAQRCRLIKDADGVYEADPALQDVSTLRRFTTVGYDDAARVARQLIQPRAVSLLRLNGGAAEVASCASARETRVRAGDSVLESTPAAQLGPSGVILLGLGTVGLGVYQRLQANSQHFQVVGILVRDPAKYRHLGVPEELLYNCADRIMGLPADLVVDTLPGIEPARRVLRHYLAHGAHGISAGKAFVVAEGGAPHRRLFYSAAVGGSTPMIEAVARCRSKGPIALSAVLNGTCNFVLNRCAAGASLQEAVSQATRAGFAEGGAHDDLSGEDAVRKIQILARQAFGQDPKVIEVQQLDEAMAERARGVVPHGRVLRQLARAALCDGEVRVTVRFEDVPRAPPFGQLYDEWNALQILLADGTLETVTGRGAGRWPTTEAVLADLFEARRQQTATHRQETSARRAVTV